MSFESNLRRLERWLIGALFLFGAGFTLLLVAVKWPRYWEYVAPEMTPMTWLESAVLFGCVVLLAVNFALSFAADGPGRRTFVWLLLTAAFLFLTLDERFALHERVRDKFLAPREIKLLPWMGAGDFLLLIYAAVGLLCLVQVYRLLRERRGAWYWFCAAVLVSLIAVSADSVDVARMTADGERLEQSLEEMLELFAMMSYFSAFLLMLFHQIVRLAGKPAG